MEIAKATVDGDIDYVNTHGTSTPAGDIVEVQNINKLFGEKMPKYGSSKSMCGHSLGATSAQEAIHCLLMLQHDFIAPSINVFDLDPALADMPPVTETIYDAGIPRRWYSRSSEPIMRLHDYRDAQRDQVLRRPHRIL
jgi:3-oxoacyl-[acyl-carrier-protein] synthase-1